VDVIAKTANQHSIDVEKWLLANRDLWEGSPVKKELLRESRIRYISLLRPFDGMVAEALSQHSPE